MSANSGKHQKLDSFQLDAIATRQKVIIGCIAVYLGLVFGQFSIPADARIVLVLPALATIIIGAIFTFMLAMKVYGTAVGLVLGLLTFVPFIGLLVLLLINTKATAVLRAHGIKVGVLGAQGPVYQEENPDEIDGPGGMPKYLRTPGSSGGPPLQEFRS